MAFGAHTAQKYWYTRIPASANIGTKVLVHQNTYKRQILVHQNIAASEKYWY